MALSYVQYSGNGATTNFAVPFQYIDSTHVHCYVGGVEVTAFTWPNASTIQFTVAPAAGTLNIEIRRVTPREVPLVDYGDGSVLFASELDTANLQSLFIAQEYFEQAESAFPTGHTLDSHSDATLGASVAKGTMRVYDVNSKWNAITAPADGGLLIGDTADAKGVRWLSKGTSGNFLQVDDAAAGKVSWVAGFKNLMTTVGDILYASAVGVAARLGIGLDNYVLVARPGSTPPLAWEPTSFTAGTTAGRPSPTTTRVVRHNTTTNQIEEWDGSAWRIVPSLPDEASTQGDVIYKGASNWERLAVGRVGAPLVSGGASANPSWDAIGTPGVHILKWGILNKAQNSTGYGACVGNGAKTVEADGGYLIPFPVLVGHLRVHASAAPPAGQTFTFTVRRGKIDYSTGTTTFEDTAITCQITSASTSASDLSASALFGPSDVIGIKCVASATTGSTIDLTITVEMFQPESLSRPLVHGVLPVAYNGVNTTPVWMGEIAVNGTEGKMQVPLPACCLVLQSAPSDSSSYGGPKQGWWPGWEQEHVKSANDLLSFSWTPVSPDGIVSYLHRRAGVLQHATSPNTYHPGVTIFSALDQAQNTTRYCGGFGNAPSATESEVQIPMPACTVRNMRVSLDSTPAAGQNFTLTLRKNGVDTALSVTVSNPDTLQADLTHSVTFASGDLLSIKSVSSATSGTHSPTILIEVTQ